ncbi:MAG: chitobiase/beta-hexosaminidase C-terminal domain-containing protein [Bryobacteraceae bacterium]
MDEGLLGTFPDGSKVLLTNSTYLAYSSDTPSVAIVDAQGNVTAVAPGTANVTVAYGNASIGTTSVQVPVNVPYPVTVNPPTISLYPSQTAQLSATLAVDPSLEQSVTWSISPQVGSIDQTGLYTAPSSLASWQGVTVTASVADPTQSASAQVWIFPPVSISITPSSATMSAAQAQSFTAPVANGGFDATWSVSPNGMGTIQPFQGTDPNNPFFAISAATYFAPAPITSPQTVTITATSVYDNSKTASAQITLLPSVAVSVSPGTASVYASQSQQFAATVNYIPNGAVVWSLSPNVGTIDATGLYTAPAVITYQQTVSVIATGPDIGAGTNAGTATVTLMPQISGSITVPAGVTVAVASNSEFDLSWTGSTEPGGSIAGYNIFRNGAWAGSTPGTSYADLGLMAGTSYTYTVAAYDAGGSTSVQSAGVSASTLPGGVPNLVAYYNFNEGAGTVLHDSSGNGNNSAITAATWTASGKYGGALVFDGASGYVTVSNASSLNLSTGMTLEAWVNPTAINSMGDVIVRYQDDSDFCFGLFSDTIGPDSVVFTAGVGYDNWISGASMLPFPLNAWTHVATTYDGATQQLFINGVQVASQPLSGAIATGAQPLYIGGDPVYSSDFNGIIDEARIYSVALSQAEIQNDMAGSANVSISLNPATTTLNPLQTQQFTPTITGSSTTGVTWSVALGTGAPAGAQPGVISPTGLYTPPSSVAAQYTVIVTAQSQADPTKSASATVTLVPTQPAEAPTFSPSGGTYTAAQTVTLNSTTSGATIRYTLDGSTPSETAGTVYIAPFTISGTTTVKAMAYASGLTDSSVATAIYTILTAAPTFSPSGGTYTTAQTVTLSSNTSGATIHYTLDGSTPSETAGTVYTAPFTISGTTTVKAMAYASGLTDSSVATAIYTILTAAPTFSPSGGTYTAAQTVTLSSTTSGATIRYTLDGSTPSETAGTVYTAPFTISGTTTVKAMAYASGLTDSSVATAIYTILTAAPKFSPSGGTYTTAQTVTLSSTTSGATIRYTLDGSTPSETAGTVYTAPFTISGTTSVKAMAYASGLTDSSVATAIYTILTAAPTFSPSGGTYTTAQTVTLSSATAGAAIRYTLDGSTPSETAGTVYTAPFTVSGTTTVKAMAYASGLTDSSVATAIYTILTAAPKFSPSGGTYTTAQTVTLSSTTSGATIHYTLDGSTPSETAGTVYAAPFTVSGTTTVKAMAYASGLTDSSVATAIYTILTAAPTFSPSGGTYTTAQTVTLSSATAGATIRYTLDGSTPSETAGTVYTAPFTISGSTTVKAMAYATGLTDSSVATAIYTID